MTVIGKGDAFIPADRGGFATDRAGRKANLLGYDLLRLAAITCVALQHLLSAYGVRPALIFGLLNLGQVGVTVFCALSGYLALRPSDEPSLSWLSRRLSRVYFPYWIALVAVVIANVVVGYKPISAALVVSQFLGVAYFTHGDGQVGVHFWFITLILICYLVAAFARVRRVALPAALLATAVLLHWDPGLGRHVFSFLVGAAIGRSGRPSVSAAILAVACLALTVGWRLEFAYPFIGALALGAGGFAGTSPTLLVATSRSVYEFYLVHGPIYLGLAKFGKFSLAANLLVGTTLAMTAAYVLRRTELAVRGVFPVAAPQLDPTAVVAK